MAKGDVKPVNPVAPSPTNVLAVTAWGTNGSLPSATGYCKPDSYDGITGVNQGNGQIVFTIPGFVPYPDWGYSITVKCEGYKDYEFRVDPKIDGNSFDVDLTPDQVLPNFTREQICNPQITFAGLTISTGQFGTQPWFETAYQCLTNPVDRKSVRDQKKTAGDTAVILEFTTNAGIIYPEPNVWLNQCFTPSGEQNPNWFKNLVYEILYDGMVPVIVFDGDNGDSPVDGYPNALRQLPILVNLLSDVNDKVLYARFWDGVFYGSSPENILNFGVSFRNLLPQGNLAIEFNPGHIPVGNGPSDYQPGGIMTYYDVIAGEFEFPDFAQDSTWQVVGRLVPNYVHPPDQPVNDDPNPPYYLGTGNPRGQYYFWAFEIGEYQWCRNQVSYSDLKKTGTYFRNMGCYNVGLPR